MNSLQELFLICIFFANSISFFLHISSTVSPCWPLPFRSIRREQNWAAHLFLFPSPPLPSSLLYLRWAGGCIVRGAGSRRAARSVLGGGTLLSGPHTQFPGCGPSLFSPILLSQRRGSFFCVAALPTGKNPLLKPVAEEKRGRKR